MSAATKLVVEPFEVDARLRELGLDQATLIGSLQDAAGAMALCTENHPPMYGGITFWAEGVRSLRERKMNDGWGRSDAKNYSTVVSPDRTIQVAIARGDEWTGREDVPEGKPSTQHRKGSATQLAVEINHQLSLFSVFDEMPPQETDATDAPTTTWVLLHFRNKHTIRCELSRPTGMNTSGFFEEWAERIILSVINLDPTKLALPDEPVIEPDVLVRRRG